MSGFLVRFFQLGYITQSKPSGACAFLYRATYLLLSVLASMLTPSESCLTRLTGWRTNALIRPGLSGCFASVVVPEREAASRLEPDAGIHGGTPRDTNRREIHLRLCYRDSHVDLHNKGLIFIYLFIYLFHSHDASAELRKRQPLIMSSEL